jgi:hypothetical protein
MLKIIYKYKLETASVQNIEMPEGAEILCVQTQGKTPCIWALVDPSVKLTKRTFEIFCTGNNIPDDVNRKYIGTYQLYGGEMVFHCFELINN